jgi:hypothetical protein
MLTETKVLAMKPLRHSRKISDSGAGCVVRCAPEAQLAAASIFQSRSPRVSPSAEVLSICCSSLARGSVSMQRHYQHSLKPAMCSY